MYREIAPKYVHGGAANGIFRRARKAHKYPRASKYAVVDIEA